MSPVRGAVTLHACLVLQFAPQLSENALMILRTARLHSAVASLRVENPRFDAVSLPEHVRIVRLHGDPLYLHAPSIVGDTIAGRLGRLDGGGRSAIALHHVQTIEASRLSRARTAWAVLGAAVLGGIVYEATRPKCTDCINLF